ncbi:MAG: glycosyltransferase family 2 protein [Paracoccaceae bacterium]
MTQVDILLATYNGAKYLPEQLASLEAQTHKDWRLIVRDDGSDDGSVDLIRHWANDVGRALVVLEDGETRLGPAASFGRLIERSDAPYFACCDQDDFWMSHKVERLLSEIQSLENELGADKPLLVHCDLDVVDANLNPTGKRFWEESHIAFVDLEPAQSFDRARASLLLQNVVTGCAMMGNADLRQRATPVPDGVHVHDWWLALIAGYFGAVRAVDEPLIKYRQHGANTIGAKSWDPWSMFKRFLADPKGTVGKTILVLGKLQRQAGAFHDSFGDDLSDKDRDVVHEFSKLAEQSYLKRKTFMIRRAVYPSAWVRRFVLFCLI